MNAPSPCYSHFSLRRFKEQLFKIPFAIVLLGLVFITSQSAFAATYTVTNTSDSGAGSLRDAINQVNAGSGGDTINFSDVTGTITLGSTLTISESITINGPGANILAISGNDAVRVFSFAGASANSVVSGLTITHGNATVAGTNNGAGISAGGTLTVNNCTLSYNKAGFSGNTAGGAIYTPAGTLTVNSSTFYNNQAVVGEGGAIYGSILVVNDSTFYNNSAQTGGGAIFAARGTTLTLRNNTIVGNRVTNTTGTSDGGAIYIQSLPPAVLANNIISGNTAVTNPDYHCTLGCGTPPTINLMGNATVTSLLTPLQYNGGPTMTMAPLPGKIGIIGAGSGSTLAFDQRGVPRSAGTSDFGAVQSYNLVVSTTADSTDPSSLCDGSNGDTCSLRDALTLANTQGAGDVVTVTGLTGTINLTSPLPDDTANLNINGPGANQLTISGAGTTGSVLNITNPTAVTNISGVTISGGSAGTNDGGGVANNGAQLTLANCAFSNNSATGGRGGGLDNLNPSGVATVTDCTFSGNTAEIGGAIYNKGTVLVTNSTLTGNTAAAHGGGLVSTRLATVVDSTIANNTAGTGGGITKDGGTLTLVNDIVAANTETNVVGSDCIFCGTQTAVNLISTNAAPITAAQLMLAPLGYYGPSQTVETMLPFPGSPAIEAGDPTQLPVDVTTDERQLPRTINGKLDLGAVESNYGSVQFVQQPSNAGINSDISPAVTLSITESGVTVANVPLTVTFTGTGSLHGTLTETTVAPAVPGDPAVAIFTGLNVDTSGTGDTLVANVTVTPPGIAPPQTLTATSSSFEITKTTADIPLVTVGPASPIYGQPDTVTITVPTTGSVPPSGTVIVYNNGVQIGTGTLGPNGSVVVTLTGGTLPAGPASITVGYNGDGNYGSSTSANVPVTVAPVVSVPTLSVGPSSTPTAGQPVTVIVTVPTVGSTPASGTVNVFDNGNQIGTGTLGPNGTVTVSIPGGLPAGSNNITAGYSGGGNYGSSTSATVAVTATATVALDFTLTRTSAQSQTIITGQAATIALQVAPTNGTYPGNVSFTATGLPANATATFAPTTVAANAGPAPVNLNIQTASLVSMNRLGGNDTSIALGLLLLPLLGARRKRLLGSGRLAGRYIFMMVVLIAGAIGMAGLTGCGSHNGFFGHAPQTYNITVTATSGTIQHSVNATLNVQ